MGSTLGLGYKYYHGNDGILNVFMFILSFGYYNGCVMCNVYVWKKMACTSLKPLSAIYERCGGSITLIGGE